MLLRAGASQSEITPPIGTPFGGFAIERSSPATGVHDPLLVTATALSSGQETVVVISCDLQTIAPDVVANVRARIQQRYEIPPRNVLVGATHVHSAPGGDASERQIPGVDHFYTTPEALERIERGIDQAVADALQRLQAVEVVGATGMVPGIGRSRHVPDEPAPAPASLLVARTVDDHQPVTAIVNYGCHPSILGPENTVISADYPAVVRRELSEQLGVPVVNFLNGPAGDISTRGIRQSQTFDEVERLGLVLSDQLKALIRDLAPIPSTPVRGASRVIDLPTDPSLLRQLQLVLTSESKPPSYRARRAELMIERVKSVGPTVPCEVQALRCGDIVFIGIAAELFSELGQMVRNQMPESVMLIAAPANGTVGNLPTSDLHETVHPIVAANADVQVRDAVMETVAVTFSHDQDRRDGQGTL